MIELKLAGFIFTNTRQLNAGHPFAQFVFRQNPKVLSRNLNRLLGQPAVFVVHQNRLYQVTAILLQLGTAYIGPAIAICGYSKVEVKRWWDNAVHRFKPGRQSFGFRRSITTRNIKCQSIGKQTAGCFNLKLTCRQCLLAEHQSLKSIWSKSKRFLTEVQEALEIPVLCLQVLRLQEGAFRPNHWLQLLHRIVTFPYIFLKSRLDRDFIALPHSQGTCFLLQYPSQLSFG